MCIDIDWIAHTEEHLQQLTFKSYFCIEDKPRKTKAVAISKENVSVNSELGNEQLEQVNDFFYLGAIITKDVSCDKDIQNRQAKSAKSRQLLENLEDYG